MLQPPKEILKISHFQNNKLKILNYGLQKKKIFSQWQKQAPTPTFFQYKQHRKGSGTLQPCFQYYLQNLENLLPGCSWKSYWDKDEKVQAEAEHTTCTRQYLQFEYMKSKSEWVIRKSWQIPFCLNCICWNFIASKCCFTFPHMLYFGWLFLSNSIHSVASIWITLCSSPWWLTVTSQTLLLLILNCPQAKVWRILSLYFYLWQFIYLSSFISFLLPPSGPIFSFSGYHHSYLCRLYI